MHRIASLIVTATAALTCLGACSSEDAGTVETKKEADQDHVWKEQTDMLERASDVQDTLDQANKDRLKQLEDDGG